MTDNETGLPELPEGYFWRVEYGRNYNLLGYTQVDRTNLDVRLIRVHSATHHRTVHKLFRTITIPEESKQEEVILTETALGTKPIAVRNAANKILKRWELVKEREALIGDYPPKKLEFTDD